MARCRDLLDALPEYAAAAHDIGDFRLVTIDLDRARPMKSAAECRLTNCAFIVSLSKGNRPKEKWRASCADLGSPSGLLFE